MSAASSLLRPRLHLHRGTVRAAAFWFDPALLGEGEARRRVLAAWMPGASVYAVAGGYLLRLPRPCVVASHAAPGLPLTVEQGVLSSAPLSATERGRLELREGSVVLVLAGVARVHPLAGASVEDLSQWLDVSTWVMLPVRGLGAPPPPVQVLEPLPPPTRAFFGPSVPTLAPEAQVMLARMAGKAPPEAPAVVRRMGLLARLRAALSGRGAGVAGAGASGPGLLARLRAAFRSPAATGNAAPANASGRESSRGPGLLARMLAALGAGAAGSGSASSASGRPGLLSWFASWFPRGDAPIALPSGTARSGAAQGGSSPAKPVRPSRLRRWLASFFGRSDKPLEGVPAPGGSGKPSSGAQQAPPTPSLLSRLSEWMLRNTPLGQLVGQRKAEYVRRLFEMFEDGNLQEALRYAIPLSKDMDGNAREALGLPGPRERLTIQTTKGGVSSVFAGGEELFAALKERYRDAFRRFEREGRIDEAAFVLAELLGAYEEAVSFLERHGRFKLAAELAEGRGLPPGLVVRQWLLAKDVARATAIARRSGAFSDAVLRLERTHPEEARVLRLLWGETLAESGDFVRAVQAVWPLSGARELARAWIQRGVECGGATGARLLALWATGFADGLESAGKRVRELLDEDGPQAAANRLSFHLALLGEQDSPRRTALVTPTARALLRDRAGGISYPASFITRLLGHAPDGTLRTDLPPLSEIPSPPPWDGDTPRPQLHATARASDEGVFPIHDAVVLPDGRMLLALGEAGVRLLREDGQGVAHFDVPAFALVPSLHGDRALALAPRGEVRRLSRLDLVARRATAWCDAPLDVWAPTYDGGVWFVASGSTVMMVDALAANLRALWRVADLPQKVVALAADAARLSFLTEGLERWTYEVPQGPTLRTRTPLMSQEEGTVVRHLSSSLTADGEVAARVAFFRSKTPAERERAGNPGSIQREERSLWLMPFGPRSARDPGPVRQDQEALVLTEKWRAQVLRGTGQRQVQLLDARGVGRALLSFEGEEPAPQVRFSAQALLAFDSRGRLLRLDLPNGLLRHVPVT